MLSRLHGARLKFGEELAVRLNIMNKLIVFVLVISSTVLRADPKKVEATGRLVTYSKESGASVEAVKDSVDSKQLSKQSAEMKKELEAREQPKERSPYLPNCLNCVGGTPAHDAASARPAPGLHPFDTVQPRGPVPIRNQ